jgi:2-polyprenyl-3-methyl-5-hydroxy-6-metoxy-1,4-benzoquinol methylase
MGKLSYFTDSLVKTFAGGRANCPSCGSTGVVIDRKWLVTALRRCHACGLIYRTPTTSIAENDKFYQSEYEQGFTTDLPDDAALDAMLKSKFAGTEKDFSRCVTILKALGATPGCRLLDFGCSWGYGSRQLADAGYRVEAFEISKPRGDYARSKLGVSVTADAVALPSRSYDVFFSSHVIEHVPSVAEMLATADRVLVPGGLFLALTPNGSDAFRKTDQAAWHSVWGQVHPQLIDDEFVRKQLNGRNWLLDSTPFDLAALSKNGFSTPQAIGLAGSELLFAYRTKA